MAYFLEQQTIGSGNSADNIGCGVGPAGYYVDLTPLGAANSTTTYIKAVAIVSANYADLLALGAGTHAKDMSLGSSKFAFGLSAGQRGVAYKPQASALSDTTIASDSKRIIGVQDGGAVGQYTIAEKTNALALYARDATTTDTCPIADSVTASVSLASASQYTGMPIFAQDPAYTSALMFSAFGIALQASGQTLQLYTRRTRAGDQAHSVAAKANLPQFCAEWLIDAYNYTERATITVTGMTAAAYLQSHPHFFIHWPYPDVRMNWHHLMADIG